MGLSVIKRHLGLLNREKYGRQKGIFCGKVFSLWNPGPDDSYRLSAIKGKGERFRNPPLDSYSITHISGF